MGERVSCRERCCRSGRLGSWACAIRRFAGGAGCEGDGAARGGAGRSTFGGFAITVLVQTDMASPHLVNAGTPGQIKRFLPKIISGEAITAVAVTEPDAGSDVRPAARPERDAMAGC